MVQNQALDKHPQEHCRLAVLDERVERLAEIGRVVDALGSRPRAGPEAVFAGYELIDVDDDSRETLKNHRGE